jgi:predicted tellurium resistance membrane protein TerC
MLDLVVSFWFLLFLEIILGVDNIIFIALLVNKLPLHLQKKARFIGLSLSLIFRLILLSFIGYLLQLSKPILQLWSFNFSIKDIIMLVGGLFLLYKATTSIHEEVSKSITIKQNKTIGFAGAISQIIFIDLIFSLDSLITAIGITSNLIVIALAIVISIIFMLIFAGKVAEFIANYPSLKMLALSFILMIGVFLMLEGFSIHVEKGYIYFAMGFSLVVELLNIFIKRKHTNHLK